MNNTVVEKIEGRMISLRGKTALMATLIAALFSLVFIYTSGFGYITFGLRRGVELHRGGYLLFTMLLCFILYPSRKGSASERVPLLSWILCLLTVITIGYWIVEYPSYAYRIGNPNQLDIIMGAILICLSFEMARRVVGNVLTTLAAIFLLYAYFGPYVPGILGHYGYSITRIVEFLGVGMGGIYGIVTDTYATYIFPFIIFASFLQAAGAGPAIEQVSLSIAGGSRGGPAKVAIVSSGIIGMITGSSAANAVATGSYTIPMMIKTGYKPHVAAAIEAAASTGGQFMPPIMGSAAFLIAAFTDTPYLDIVKIAAIPAILYFLGVGMMVHFIAARNGLKGLPKEKLPKLKTVILQRGYLLLPIPILLGVLIAGFSPQKAAFVAIISSILLSYIKKETRMNFRQIFDALVTGARNSLIVGATAGVIGIIIGVVVMTGLGIKFSSIVLSLSGGILPLTILLTAVGGYIIGMGVTITATYILLSVLAVPALVELEVPLLTAHLVVFWLCEIGGVTPPVALVAFAASAIARCNPSKAGLAAVRLASPLFIAPFLFVYTPILLNGPLPQVIETIVSSAIGTIAYAGMMQGYWMKRANVLERILLGFASLCLFIPDIFSDILGIAVLAAITVINRKKHESG
ncbi:MAG: TRAP transporter fused permease subunit [Pseudomonadota bacterium]|nr:TRAP transporter fused permease subunit [Pseudomonadota bacterium]